MLSDALGCVHLLSSIKQQQQQQQQQRWRSRNSIQPCHHPSSTHLDRPIKPQPEAWHHFLHQSVTFDPFWAVSLQRPLTTLTPDQHLELLESRHCLTGGGVFSSSVMEMTGHHCRVLTWPPWPPEPQDPRTPGPQD
ncbi:uncharacterized protein V6R79_016087 [Siganus canaliculatus]